MVRSEYFKDLGLKAKIVDDPRFVLSEKIGMQKHRLPVLINSDGIIISEAAVGPPNIWALIGVHSGLKVGEADRVEDRSS